MDSPREAQWAPDPYRRHELRYWDGSQWTEHVSEGDGAILNDPPLPSPRGRRQARTAADDGASLADFVGGHATQQPGHAQRRPAPEFAGVPTPSRGASSGRPVVEAPHGGTAHSHRASSRPTPDLPPAHAGAAPSAPRSGRGDLFAELAGRAPRPAGPVPGGRGAPPAYATAEVGDAGGWDWRDSRIPEILSGVAVAALIAVAAVIGSGQLSAPAGDAVESVVSTPSSRVTRPATGTKKPVRARTTVPAAQISTAKPGRVVRRTSSTSARATTSPPTPTTTKSSPTSAPPDSSSTSTKTSEPPPSSSSSSPPSSSPSKPSSTKTK